MRYFLNLKDDTGMTIYRPLGRKEGLERLVSRISHLVFFNQPLPIVMISYNPNSLGEVIIQGVGDELPRPRVFCFKCKYISSIVTFSESSEYLRIHMLGTSYAFKK